MRRVRCAAWSSTTVRCCICASSRKATIPTDRIGAMNYLPERHALGEIVTGLLYVDSSAEDLHRHLNTVAKPLNRLGDATCVPATRLWKR